MAKQGQDSPDPVGPSLGSNSIQLKANNLPLYYMEARARHHSR